MGIIKWSSLFQGEINHPSAKTKYKFQVDSENYFKTIKLLEIKQLLDWKWHKEKGDRNVTHFD